MWVQYRGGGLLTGSEVLINSTGTGTLGRVALTHASFGEVMFADTHVTVVRPDPALADARYIAYVLGLDSFARFAEEALSVGATKQKELNVEALRNHMILVPDYVRSQAVIADFPDRERQRIDSARMSALKLAADAGTELSKRVHHLLDRERRSKRDPAAAMGGYGSFWVRVSKRSFRSRVRGDCAIAPRSQCRGWDHSVGRRGRLGPG